METVTDHTDLLVRAGGDPWVRWALPDPLRSQVWVHEDVALVERRGERTGFWVAPLRPGMPWGRLPGDLAEEETRVRAALTRLRADGLLEELGSRSVSVPQEHSVVAHEVLDLGDGGDWEWMWTGRTPAPDPRETALELLDDSRDAEEIAAFSHRHNPRVWTAVGTGRVVRWVGLRDAEGHLLAVGGAETAASGAAHLAGIVTAAGARGRGLGTLVSTALTRWAVAELGVCTLGMFSDNEVARRIYRRLGYRTARAWHSRTLTRTR